MTILLGKNISWDGTFKQLRPSRYLETAIISTSKLYLSYSFTVFKFLQRVLCIDGNLNASNLLHQPVSKIRFLTIF